MIFFTVFVCEKNLLYFWTVVYTVVFIFKFSLCLFVYKITGNISRRFVLTVGWTTMGFVTITWRRSRAGTALLAHARLLRQSWSASTPSPNRNCCWNGSWLVGWILYWSEIKCYSLEVTVITMLLVVSGPDSKVWIGLHKEAKLPAVQWSDNSPVTFTSWYSQEPSHRHGDKRICVTADQKVRSEVVDQINVTGH